MSKNIKEIGKELLGKSLNSFHRKTGLTQLEKNNEMQDGILDGILSQVDDTYIEKTEQSNVIHLDGSGDGVVVLDSIEGNTMVNLIGTALDDTTYYRKNPNGSIDIIKHNKSLPPFNNDNYHNLNLLKPNTQYTLVVMGEYSKIKVLLRDYFIDENGINNSVDIKNMNLTSSKTLFTTNNNRTYMKLLSAKGGSPDDYPIQNIFVMILEGDWTNKEIPASYFEGLQSSFEEKVNDEGKYEIEILSKNNNLIPIDAEFGYLQSSLPTVGVTSYYECYKKTNTPQTRMISEPLELIEGKTMFFKCNNYQLAQIYFDKNKIFLKDGGWLSNTDALNPPQGAKYIASYIRKLDNSLLTDYDLKYVSENAIFGCYNSYSEIEKVTIPHKQNKIKLLINEPLRAVGDIKDRLCVKDSKLVVERNLKEIVINNTSNIIVDGSYLVVSVSGYNIKSSLGLSDKFAILSLSDLGKVKGLYIQKRSDKHFYVWFSNNENTTVQDLKTWLQNNPTKLVFQTIEPFYEEVTNEYGEPIILEGYENGTLYIDSTIIPTTTVKYTPKMESLNTLKEVTNNNIMLTSDVNDNIIPYMMEVDLMIMEKEMALPSQINNRKVEVLDMTSMQKRTQEMLERLIKGKTLTEQECKTRVTTYLNAGKITDEQAEELMLVISEIYN